MYCIVMFIAERKVKEATRYFLVQRTNQRDVWIHVEAWNLLKVFWKKKVTQGRVLHRKYSVRNFGTFNTLCLPQLWKALTILYNVHNSKHWQGIGAQKQTSALSNIPKQIGYLFIHSNALLWLLDGSFRVKEFYWIEILILTAKKGILCWAFTYKIEVLNCLTSKVSCQYLDGCSVSRWTPCLRLISVAFDT